MIKDSVSVEVQTDELPVEIPSTAANCVVEASYNVIETEHIERLLVSGNNTITSTVSAVAATDGIEHLINVRDNTVSHSIELARVHEKKHLESMEFVVKLEQDLVEAKATINSLQHELDDYIERCRHLESTAEGDRASTLEQIELLSMEVQRMKEERVELELQIEARERKMKEEEEIHRQTLEAKQDVVCKLVNERSELQSRLTDVQTDAHKQISKLKSKVLKLTNQLEASSASHLEEIHRVELRVAELGDELNVANEANDRLQSEINEIQRRALLDADERTASLQKDLQTAVSELESSNMARLELQLALNSTNSEYKATVVDYSQRIEQLQSEIRELQTYIDERRTADEHTANLALDLEKEKGRLAALLQSHNTLKEHAQLLEASLANQTSSQIQLGSESREHIERLEYQLMELSGRCEQLESMLSKERQTVKDLRGQFMTEKGNHIKVRRQLEQVTTDYDQLVADSKQLRESLDKMSADIDTFMARELELKLAAERATADLRALSLDRDRVIRELEDQKGRDEALEDNIQGLEWRLSEKDSEIAAAKETLRIVEERQLMEMAAITQTLQSNNSELSTVREELNAVKKERTDLQLKMTQLKTALKSAISTKVDLSVATDTTAELERLLHDSAPASVSSKPLSFLQATLSGLRGEISSLQTQINEHTSAVQSSSLAWRELEAQVQDLREVCKTSAADRAAVSASRSTSLLPTTAGSVVSPAGDTVVMADDGVTVAVSARKSQSLSSSCNLDSTASSVSAVEKSSLSPGWRQGSHSDGSQDGSKSNDVSSPVDNSTSVEIV
jgi:chromosome segregation ATPase